jgi:superfamily II DNA or RNA helicase
VTRFERGMRVRIPGASSYLTIEDVVSRAHETRLYLVNETGGVQIHDVKAVDEGAIEILTEDGCGSSTWVLAGLWSEWMQQAICTSRATVLSTSPLRPYLHQDEAVYGAMLPQPMLRFLLADEPGTGKTIMAGLYLREMQRLGLIRRALIVAPAHLVSKWQADFRRFFGGAPERVTSEIVAQGPLRPDRDVWIVSLDLAAANPTVQREIRPDRAGWDLVIFDEAHRMTPTAETFYRVGRLLSRETPRALLMTATPHRGKEWLFRSLLHLVDPEVYPEVGRDDEMHQCKPGPLHFIRRIKEELVDRDGVSPLFRSRTAFNEMVPLGPAEQMFYRESLELVSRYFPESAIPLARMVYGKRAASCLYSLFRTLERRRDRMGSALPAEISDASEYDDTSDVEERRILVESSTASREEKREIADLLRRLEPVVSAGTSSKWRPFLERCLLANEIKRGSGEQAVVFTEFADTASWLVDRLRAEGYTAERYSGQDPHYKRDEIRDRFARREFEILVSTDAGNEGIDLQSAHILVNWDIPWSLVRLEQRMGRIHRVGQDREVKLYNLIARDTEEGDVLAVLLVNLVTAANQLGGKLFDSLSLVVELVGEELGVDLDPEQLVPRIFHGDFAGALEAAEAMTAAKLEAAARRARAVEDSVSTKLDVAAASERLNAEALERVNPKIVEAYLTRVLVPTNAWTVSRSVLAGGDGVFVLRRSPHSMPLPGSLGPANEATVATSGIALERIVEAGGSASSIVALGPAEAPFRDLVDTVAAEAESHFLRGGLLSDHTSITGYDLFAFAIEYQEGGGGIVSTQKLLLRADSTGARVVRWEKLADLSVVDGDAGPLHPAYAADSDQCASAEADRIASARRETMARWREGAERHLIRLPGEMTRDIKDPDQRRSERRRLNEMTQRRLAELTRITDLNVLRVKRVGWARVKAMGLPPEPSEKDSEIVAMNLIAAHLRGEGWRVSDVHSEDRGYDLHATRGRDQRCIEIKGIWESASSTGVSLTANEVLIASQLGADYWLYVADRCGGGGRIFGIYRDPSAIFADSMRGLGTVHITGSALVSARDSEDAA